MPTVKLTDAQISALECSGVLEAPDTPDEVLVCEAYDAGRMRFDVAAADRILSALVEMSNSEDESAISPTGDRDTRRGARGAQIALTNLIDKIHAALAA